MHIPKSTVLLILGFGAATLADIYPDLEPCAPVPLLDGEYKEEYDTRITLDDLRCDCLFPGPALTEKREQYDERNSIDIRRCGVSPTEIVIPVWYNVGGIEGVPAVGGPGAWRKKENWREDRFTRNGVWRGGREHRKQGDPIPRPGPRRPEPGRPEPPRPVLGRPEPPHTGRPEPGRQEPPHTGRPEPGRQEPPHIGRPEPGRQEPPHIGRPEPARQEPPHPAGRPGPGKPESHPVGKGGRPRL